MIAQSCGVRTLCTYSIANVPYHELCMRACISTTTVCWQSLQSPMASPRHWCMIWRSHKRWRWLEPQPGQNGEYLHLRLRKLGKVFVQHWTYYGWQWHKSKVFRITAISYKYGDQTAAAVATKELVQTSQSVAGQHKPGPSGCYQHTLLVISSKLLLVKAIM